MSDLDEFQLSPQQKTLIQAAVNAVGIQLAPNSSQQDRANAADVRKSTKANPVISVVPILFFVLKYTEKLKKDSQSLTIAFHLIRPNFDGAVRLYGCSIIEYHVKTHWEQLQSQDQGSHSPGGFTHQSKGFGSPTQVQPSLLTDKQKSSLQNSMLSLMSFGTREMLDEEMYVKEKIAAVLVEIAKRSWPGQWVHLMPSLIPNDVYNLNTLPNNGADYIAMKGPTQLELVAIFFKSFAEELGSLSNLPPSRRKLITMQLNAYAKQKLFAFFYQQLDFHYGLYKQCLSQFPQITPDQLLTFLPQSSASSFSYPPNLVLNSQQESAIVDLRRCIFVIHAVLKSLVAFAEWVEISAFLNTDQDTSPSQSNANLPQYRIGHSIPPLLADPPFRLVAAELLLVLVSRPRPDRDSMYFLFEHVDTFAAALETVPPQAILNDVQNNVYRSNTPSLQFCRRVCQVLCLMGQIYLDCIKMKHSAPQAIDLFMTLLLNVSSHPSLYISSLASTFWKKLLSSPSFQHEASYVTVAQELIQQLSLGFVKWPFHLNEDGHESSRSNNSPASSTNWFVPESLYLFRLIDFEEDEEQYDVFLQDHMTILMDSILHPITFYLPLVAFTWIKNQWNACVDIFNQLSNHYKQTGEAPSSEVLNALCAMFHSVCRCVSYCMDEIGPQHIGSVLSKESSPQARAMFDRTTPRKKSPSEAVEFQESADCKSQLLSTVSYLCENIASFDSEVDRIRASQISCLKSFCIFYLDNQAALDFVLSQLVPLIVYEGKDAFSSGSGQSHKPQSPAHLPKGVRHVRKAAAAVLIAIGTKLPSGMVHHVPHIMSLVGEWIGTEKLTGGELIMMMDWVSSLSNAMTLEEQAAFLTKLIEPQVVQVQDQALGQATMNPESLLAFCGIASRPSKRQQKQGILPNHELLPQDFQTATSNRITLLTLISSFDAVWKRVANREVANAPDGSLVEASDASIKASLPPNTPTSTHSALSIFDLKLLLPVLRIVACIHQTSNPDFIEKYSDINNNSSCFTIPISVIQSWLKSSQYNTSFDSVDNHQQMDTMMIDDGLGFDIDDVGRSISHSTPQSGYFYDSLINNSFFNRLRDRSYSVLGWIINHGNPFWTDSAELLDSFNAAVLVQLDSIHPFHLSLLLKKVVLPCILTVPEHAFPYLQRLLESVFHHAGNLVTKCYKSPSQVLAQNTQTSQQSRMGFGGFDHEPKMAAEEEIIQDRSIASLLTILAQCIDNCVIATKRHKYHYMHASSSSAVSMSDFTTYDSSSSNRKGSKSDAPGMETDFNLHTDLSNKASKYEKTLSTNLTPMMLDLMRQGNGATHWLLTCVIGVFEWGEAASTKRMIRLLSTLIAAIQKSKEDRLLHPQLLNGISPSTPLSGFNKNPHQSSKVHQKSNLTDEQIREINSKLPPAIPAIDNSTTQFIQGSCLTAVLSCLHRQTEYASMLTGLVSEIYLMEDDHSLCHPVLQKLPEVTYMVLQKFDKDMSHQSTEKGRAGIVKQLLEKTCGWNLLPQSSHLALHGTRILDISPNLFAQHLAQRRKATKEKEALDDQESHGLATLFASP